MAGLAAQKSAYAVTTVMRAILDSARSGDADTDMLEQALAEGLRRGLVTRMEVKQAKARVDVSPLLKQILEKA